MPLLYVGGSMFLSLLWQLFGIFIGIVAFGIVCLLLYAACSGDSKKIEVHRTTRFYNDIGNLVDAKFDIDYVDLPDNDAKKK